MSDPERLTEKDLLLVALNFLASMVGIIAGLELEHAIAANLPSWTYLLTAIIIILIFGQFLLRLSKMARKDREKPPGPLPPTSQPTT